MFGFDGLVLGNRATIDHHRYLVGAEVELREEIRVRGIRETEVVGVLADDLDSDVHTLRSRGTSFRLSARSYSFVGFRAIAFAYYRSKTLRVFGEVENRCLSVSGGQPVATDSISASTTWLLSNQTMLGVWTLEIVLVFVTIQLLALVYLYFYHSEPPARDDLEAERRSADDATVCSTCGTENDPHYRYCRHCASDLSGESIPGYHAHSPSERSL